MCNFLLGFVFIDVSIAALQNVSKSNISLYSYTLDLKENFAFASMLEHLVFLEALYDINHNTSLYINVDNPNTESIEKYLDYIANLVK